MYDMHQQIIDPWYRDCKEQTANAWYARTDDVCLLQRQPMLDIAQTDYVCMDIYNLFFLYRDRKGQTVNARYSQTDDVYLV